VRRGRTAKQRLWLGPGRYRRRCRDAVTNSFAVSYGNSNRYAFFMRAGNADADGNADTIGYSASLQLVCRSGHAYPIS
jgi:hypothetical protein